MNQALFSFLGLIHPLWGSKFSAAPMLWVGVMLVASACAQGAETNLSQTSTHTPALQGSNTPTLQDSNTPSAQSLFDGHTLKGWRETAFGGHGEIEVKSGEIILNTGDPFTGINYTNEFPKMNYEVSLDAMRVMGSDFFCGLTVPVGDTFCSLIVGGWGGSLVGISSLDGEDASENETTKFMNFESKRWYHIRLRVTVNRIEGWIDKEKLVNVNTKGKQISLRFGDIELSKPFGIASWQTAAALKNIEVLRVSGPADARAKER